MNNFFKLFDDSFSFYDDGLNVEGYDTKKILELFSRTLEEKEHSTLAPVQLKAGEECPVCKLGKIKNDTIRSSERCEICTFEQMFRRDSSIIILDDYKWTFKKTDSEEILKENKETMLLIMSLLQKNWEGISLREDEEKVLEDIYQNQLKSTDDSI